jgi:hypothetical protein
MEKDKEDWTNEILELEIYFEKANLPVTPINLYPHLRVNDVKKFIQGHLDAVWEHNGTPVFKPYLDRLKRLRMIVN